MRYTIEEMESAYSYINKNAKPLLAFIGALTGLIPAFGLYFLYSDMGAILWVMLALPPLVIGLFSKFVGRTYKATHRISVGVVGALVHLAGCYMFQLNPIAYLMVPVAFVISMTSAKIKLDRVHHAAILQADLGKINTNKNLKSDS